jgi:hypothetical protein
LLWGWCFFDQPAPSAFGFATDFEDDEGSWTLKAGDTIKHGPSGETWVVAAVSPDGKDILCCGWPETMAAVADCELLKACSLEESVEQSQSVAKSCHDQCRGSWARETLRKMQSSKT